MKKSVVWTAAAVAAVGFGVPAFAAIASPGHIRQIAPTPVVSVAAPDWTTTIEDSTTNPPATLPTINVPVNSVEDISGNCDEAEHAGDAACAGLASAETTNTSTPSSVEDVSGNCDEAEHANDADCAGGGADTEDNSGKGNGDSGDDNSGHGSNNSGSGHGGGDG